VDAAATWDEVAARKALAALKDLRAARRRRYIEDFEWVETLYRVYLLAILAALGIALVSGALGDATVTHHTVDDIARDGPALLGLLAAGAVATGVRSGGRGGPLAIEATEVQHVLLSPVDRGNALRGIALRRLRTLILAGCALGAIAANFAFRRLPGDTAEWLLCGVLFGAAIPISGFGAAMAASGRRLRPLVATTLAVLVVAWSLGDVLLGARTSPATMLGEVAVWPIHRTGASPIPPAAGVVVAFAIGCLGLASLAGTSLEAARRRADLAAQLRFAVTVQDLRAVILVRRELASELPRSRPWLRLRPSSGPDGAVWHRAWQSYLRWPVIRIARVSVLGGLAGVALCGAWSGTTPLVLAAAAALMTAAFDAIEPLAQEIDHPTRRDLLPVERARLIRRHLLAPVALMLVVVFVAVAAAIATSGSTVALEVGAVVAFPTALLVLLSACLTATSDPHAYLLVPALGYVQTAIPFALAAVATLPVVVAREASQHGHSPAAAAAASEVEVLAICALTIWFLSRRVSRRRWGESPVARVLDRMLGGI
jgi:hypothetical protein